MVENQAAYPGGPVGTAYFNQSPSTVTHVGPIFTFCAEPVKLTQFQPFQLFIPCTVHWFDASNVLGFSSNLTLLATASSGFLQARAVVLKGDSLLMATSRCYNADFASFRMQASEKMPVFANLIKRGMPYDIVCQGMENIENTTQVICSDGSAHFKIFKMDLTDNSVVGERQMVGALRNTYYLSYIPSIESYLVVVENGGTDPIVAKVDLMTIKNPTFNCVGCAFQTIDNLNDANLAMFSWGPPPAPVDTQCIINFNRKTWWVGTDFVKPLLTLQTYGTNNPIMNFGPYQYWVIVPQTWVGPSTIVGVNKLTFLVASTFVVLSGNFWHLPHPGTMGFEKDVFFFILFDHNYGNLNSYFQIGDRCVERDSNLVCQKCLTNFYRHPSGANNLCNETSAIDKGYGIVRNTDTVQPCFADHCVACLSDYETCSECDAAAGYVMNKGKCHLKDFNLTSKKLAFGYNTATFTFDQNVTVVNRSSLCLSKTTVIKIKDEILASEFTCEEVNCYANKLNERTIEVKFTPPNPILNGSLTFVKSDCVFIESSESGEVFSHYPISVSEYRAPEPSTTVNKGKETAEVVSKSRIPLSIVNMAKSTSSSRALDSMFCKMTLFLYLNGPLITEPNAILNNTVELDFLPIDLPNPFAAASNRVNCTLSFPFSRNAASCDFLGNYGIDFLALLGFLLLGIIISTSVLLCTNRLIKKTKEDKVNRQDSIQKLRVLSDTFGLSMFFVKLRGNSLEISIYLMLNFAVSNSQQMLVVGMIVAIIWMGYLAASFMCTWLLAIQIRDQCISHIRESRRLGLKVEKKTEIESILKEHNLKSELLWCKIHFDELCITDSMASLLEYPIETAKNFCQAVCLVGVAGSPTEQLLILAFLEGLYLAYFIAYNVRSSWISQAFDILLSLFILVYFLCELVAVNPNVSEQTRQTSIAKVMVACIYGIMAVAVLFSLMSLCILIYTLVTKSGQWFRQKREKAVVVPSKSKAEYQEIKVTNIPSANDLHQVPSYRAPLKLKKPTVKETSNEIKRTTRFRQSRSKQHNTRETLKTKE